MKRLFLLLCLAAACAVQASCGLQPKPGWAPSPPPATPNTVAPWGDNWATFTR